jgi:hypothetical protein
MKEFHGFDCQKHLSIITMYIIWSSVPILENRKMSRSATQLSTLTDSVLKLFYPTVGVAIPSTTSALYRCS